MSLEQTSSVAPVQSIVMRLESRVIQIQAVSQPGDTNCGPHVQLYALCEDGSVWVKYSSSGYSNVPTHGGWELVESA